MMNVPGEKNEIVAAKSLIGRRSVVLIDKPGVVPRLAARRRSNLIIVAANATSLDAIAQAVVSSPRKSGVLVIPWLPRSEIFPVLLRGFYRVLPLAISAFPNNVNGLCDALTAGQSARIVGAVPDLALAAVTFFRADLSAVCVPGPWFEQNGGTGTANINSLQIEDDGTMIRLGPRRWQAHDVIAAFDANFRRTLRRLELIQSDSLGGLIRRTRKQLRLAREEFPGIDAKTIARIERNEIVNPQRETLRLIAQTLGLPVEILLEKIAARAAKATAAASSAAQPDERAAGA